jgi:hypothetical protein
MTPASAVSIAAAAGAKKAATGIRVGSLPVSNTGSVMPKIVAKVQSTRVATDGPIQVGCHLALPRSRLIAHRIRRVPRQLRRRCRAARRAGSIVRLPQFPATPDQQFRRMALSGGRE